MKKEEKSNYKNYGLIGKDISYSFSPSYFATKFRNEHIPATYKLYDLKSIQEFPNIFLKKTVSGLNVTIPYKEDILLFMDELSPAASKIGAVNTIQIKGQRLIGHNTDYIGFYQSIQPLLRPHHTHALILGTGGATKAVQYALDQLNIAHKTVSRSANKADYSYDTLTAAVMTQFPIIINCTPVGTAPQVDKIPPIPITGVGKEHLVYDLIYNPVKTLLLQEAEKNGAVIKNGLEMLEIQAEEAWKIWTL